MITEDYCSYEVARLLKEKGFEGICDYAYSNKGNYFEIDRSNFDEVYCLRPTHQTAIKWLREVHKICIVVYPFTHRERGTYTSDICTTTMTMEEGHLRGVWNTYEEAIEESIKYCLENLI